MILFHTGIGGVSGGFIGVDVFFVVSGYLVTSIIVRDVDAKRFRTANFSERRIRRIYPALLLVHAVTAVAAHVFLMPREYGKFGRTLAEPRCSPRISRSSGRSAISSRPRR